MDNYPDGVSGSDPYFNEPDEVEVIDHERDAEDIKNLAIAQALYKTIAAEVKTGDEFNLRGRVDAIMRERRAEAKKLGIAPKSFDVEIDGEKVGTYSFSLTKGEPARTEMRLQVDSQAALLEWALEHGYVNIDMNAVQSWVELTGEVPAGCEIVPFTVPAKPGGEVKSASLRIDPQAVVYSLGDSLGEVARYLLEGE